MLRFGLISELGTGKWKGFARVHFDEIDMVSYWLPLPSNGTKDVKDWVSLPVNTQVAVMYHPDGEQHIIIGALWSTADTPPSWANDKTRGTEYPDGTKIYYDYENHKMAIRIGSNGTIEVNGGKDDEDIIKDTTIEINGGMLGGLVKVEALTSNINERETRINAIVAALQSMVTALGVTPVSTSPLTGATLAGIVTTAITSILTPLTSTIKDTLENTKVKH